MSVNPDKQSPDETKQDAEDKSKKPCPDELIKTHSADPDHIITDEDINNLKTGEGCK